SPSRSTSVRCGRYGSSWVETRAAVMAAACGPGDCWGAEQARASAATSALPSGARPRRRDRRRSADRLAPPPASRGQALPQQALDSGTDLVLLRVHRADANTKSLGGLLRVEPLVKVQLDELPIARR